MLSKHSVKESSESAFLVALGAHCRRLRERQGLSIDRLSKIAERLSTSVIHRLEQGSAPVTVSSLFRYAAALRVHPKELFDFALEMDFEAVSKSELLAQVEILPLSDSQAKKEAFQTTLPLYSPKAAAGYFGQGEEVEQAGWVRVGSARKLNPKMFVLQIQGSSMEPRISDGDYLVFEAHPVGTRQGKIVLAQYRGPADPDTGGSYTIKVYHSVKRVGPTGEWEHREISLNPTNPDYEPIVLSAEDQNDFKIIAEFLFKI